MYKPRFSEHLQVDEIHKIYYELHGDEIGTPIVFLHGGPGFGCVSSDAKYFDLAFYNVILFDQRGAGKSEPAGEIKLNTTQHLINDMEALRKHLNIDKWILFGGSWGSTLAIAYGGSHPERCLGFILRGVFIADKPAIDQLLFDMGKYHPEAYANFAQDIPKDKLLDTYYEALLDKDLCMDYAIRFMEYDELCARALPNPFLLTECQQDKMTTLAVARFWFYYAKHGFFLAHDQLITCAQILSNRPCIIVHGRHDLICPPVGAWKVHQVWKKSKLFFVENAGHSALEPGIEKHLKLATQEFQKLFTSQI